MRSYDYEKLHSRKLNHAQIMQIAEVYWSIFYDNEVDPFYDEILSSRGIDVSALMRLDLLGWHHLVTVINFIMFISWK